MPVQKSQNFLARLATQTYLALGVKSSCTTPH